MTLLHGVWPLHAHQIQLKAKTTQNVVMPEPNRDTFSIRFGQSTLTPEQQLQQKLALLKSYAERLTRLREIGQVLSWDQHTWPLHRPKGLPEGALEARASQTAILATMSHQVETSKELGQVLNFLKQHQDKLSDNDRKLLAIMADDYQAAVKIPESFVSDHARAATKSMAAWEQAYEKSDFSIFASSLKEMVQFARKNAEIRGYTGSPYNALLNMYEPGMSVEKLDTLFGGLKKELTTLVKAIQQKPQPETGFLHRYFDTAKQYKFSRKILETMGFELKRGRLALSVHPFTTSMGGRDDVGLTIRTRQRDLMDAIGSAFHEGGHGLYDQGVGKAWQGTPVTQDLSLGVHESQSRLWELMVGKSRSAWKYLYPQLQQVFPKQLGNVTLDDFYKGINKVQPSYIRTEADEVTYILHVIIRYEIEKDLIEGKLQVDDIPKVWNQKMKDYLGITPPNDQKGCLQDVHWSDGSLGYFPTYALGTMGAAQFFNKAKQEIPNLEQKIEAGDFIPLRNWLNDKVHQNGRTEKPDEIYTRVTGEPLTEKYLLDYLWDKYGKLYGIQRPAQNSSPS